MVYCGRPSKSCRQCRNRDIKCDKQKDGCGQCKRAKLTCPLYPNPGQVIFKDQTQAIINKSNKKVISHGAEPLGRPLLASTEDRGKMLFVHRESSSFEWLPIFFNMKSRPVVLGMAVRAVGLVYLAYEHQSQEILRLARERYGLVLRMVSTALSNLKTSRDNSILLTVMLLDCFEKTVERLTTGCMPCISKHMIGALTILKAAEKEQFKDIMRIQMLRQIMLDILLGCMEEGRAAPSDLLEVMEQARVTDPDWIREDRAMLLLSIVTARARAQSQVGHYGSTEGDSGIYNAMFRKITSNRWITTVREIQLRAFLASGVPLWES